MRQRNYATMYSWADSYIGLHASPMLAPGAWVAFRPAQPEGQTPATLIGDYSFHKPLQPGDQLVFTDQMHYSFVKTNTFNDTPLANLAIRWEDGRVEQVSHFGYEEFRRRLGR